MPLSRSCGGAWQVVSGYSSLLQGRTCSRDKNMTKEKQLFATKQSTIGTFVQPRAIAQGPSTALLAVPDNATLLEAIVQSCDALDAKLEASDSDIVLLCKVPKRAVVKITEAEAHVSRVKDMVTSLQKSHQAGGHDKRVGLEGQGCGG
ncbi:hypothetical protein NDU88_003944 [Pleurodeles waltl]|uniref:Uncharacterized protein n=1 Tax=Pleurodeles waltl TaxID=8319 RepID=A0AAV7RHP3_PLEWA|nr:hypothetical protein NDU88_003944 [Pleurodeles waltl]